MSKLRSILEEVRQQANSFLQYEARDATRTSRLRNGLGAPRKKLREDAEAEPKLKPSAATPERPQRLRAPRRVRRERSPPKPADREDAIERVASAARFWRTEDPYSPAPYLMLRGMRWGELRAAEALDPSTFDAPNSETRTSLKRLLMEGSYAEAIEIAETAMATPAGRAWLDLQRYVVTAAENLGYTAIAEAIKAELAALLKIFPDLKTSSLMDDTPCANNDTVEWLNGFAGLRFSVRAHARSGSLGTRSRAEAEGGEEGEKVPDAFELAMEAARSGRQQDAFEILIREASHQNSGRGRFQRRLQLAQVCLSTGAEDDRIPDSAGTRGDDRANINWKNGNRPIWWRMRLRSCTGVCRTAAFRGREEDALFEDLPPGSACKRSRTPGRDAAWRESKPSRSSRSPCWNG